MVVGVEVEVGVEVVVVVVVVVEVGVGVEVEVGVGVEVVMKAKPIDIAGFTSDLSPDDKPSISIYGQECSGKTRFAITAPDPIGLMAIDKKSKRTAEAIAQSLGKVVIANSKPFLSDAIKLALIDGESSNGLAEIKNSYAEVLKRVFDAGMTLASHKDVQTIVVDTCSQVFDYILFSHFGRRNQIKPTSRGAVNQDMIDFVNALRSKHLILIHRSKEVWKGTGVRDKDGNEIKEPSGKFETDGFAKIGGFVTTTLELTNVRKAGSNLDDKFHCKVVSCQTKPELEGVDLKDYGVSGEEITWDNVAAVLGM